MQVTEHLRTTSKKLRKAQAPWEQKLWQFLRAKRLNDLKFKRQVPIGNYVVDFCCDEKRLIVELDGGQHDEDKQRHKDQDRANFLHDEGYAVLRFWNNEIDSNLEGVLNRISEVSTSLPASPLARGEG